MAKARTLVGLDVHAAKVVAAILDSATGELRFQRLGGESEPVVKLLSSLDGPVRASYEAGPTGYGLARALDVAGVECVVAAPGKIPRGATEKVKTDRRDAEHLVRLLLAGKLHPVRVPGPPEEALRDLVRAVRRGPLRAPSARRRRFRCQARRARRRRPVRGRWSTATSSIVPAKFARPARPTWSGAELSTGFRRARRVQRHAPSTYSRSRRPP